MLKVKCLMNPGRITLRAYVEGAEIYFRVNKVSISLTQKIDNDITAENRAIITEAFVKINSVYEAKTAEGVGSVEMAQAIVEAIEVKKTEADAAEDDGFSVPASAENLDGELIKVLEGNGQKFEFHGDKFHLFTDDGSRFQIARAGDVLLQDEDNEKHLIAVSGKTAEVLAFREAKVKATAEASAPQA